MMTRTYIACALAAGWLIGSAQSPNQPAGAENARERAYRENNIGVARLEQYDYREAAASFRRALEADQRLAAARLNLAIALLYDSQLDEADREARAAADQMPSAPQPPYVRGLIARLAGRDADAAASFRRVLAIDPADVGARIQLGQTLIIERRNEEAIRLFDEAVKAEPFNATAAYGLATALTRAGRAEESRQAMARFQQLRDNPASVTYSSSYLGQGRDAEALASTGLEPELIDTTMPAVSFVDATAVMVGSRELGANPQAPRLTFGARVDVSGGMAAALDRIAASLATGVTLADIDGDGQLDLILVVGHAVLVRRHQPRGFDTNEGADVRVEGTTPIAAVAGDYDNDGRADLFVLGHPASRLFHQSIDGRFQDVTQAAGLPPATALARTAAFVDVDHDGDLDLFLGGLAGVAGPTRSGGEARFPQEFAPAPNQLLRNNGNGRFSDATAEAHLAGAGEHTVAIVPTDYDNRRDVDLLVVGHDDRPALFSNLRDGTFRDVAQETGLAQAAPYTAVAAADVNKDGAIDFFFGRAGAPGVFVMSTGSGRFAVSDAPVGTRDATSAQFVDYDNDGVLDLLVTTGAGAGLWRNLGTAWVDATARALPAALISADEAPVAIAMGDLDGDGDTDAVVRLASGRVRVWRNEGGSARASLRVRLAARVSNRSGIGSKVELRAGSLRHKIETSSATPAVGPSDVLFGLGRRDRADVVRVLWPSGILQAETDLPAPATRGSGVSMVITELDRKPSSCPFLYTWNGTRFEFVTDFMGGGEMGAWHGPGAQDVPDSDEYVRVGRDQLQARNGRYDVRVTNELEEAMFVDRLQLVSVAHPANVDVYPNEGLRSFAERRPFALYTVRAPLPPLSATDEHGHDVLDRVARIDRRYVDDFRLEPIRGYAQEHAVTVKVDVAGKKRLLLLLTGWTDYAFSSDNVAAYQAGLPSNPPAVQVRDESGAWRTAVAEIGVPVGRPQTIVVDLTSVLAKRRSPSRPTIAEVRVVTTLRVYWDQILVDTSDPAAFTIDRIDSRDAMLRWRGYSAETTPDGREPFGYDYDRVSRVAPWKTMPGQYTRFGDVVPLLTAIDDRFVVSAPGDEIALSFDAAGLTALRAGWTRSFFLYADGFSKEMDLHSSSPDRLEPLPFHGMSRYPYAPPEHYPATPAHERYRATYNTRIVGGPIPPLFTRAPLWR
jgi:Tfp pilus assembly protein PilF